MYTENRRVSTRNFGLGAFGNAGGAQRGTQGRRERRTCPFLNALISIADNETSRAEIAVSISFRMSATYPAYPLARRMQCGSRKRCAFPFA